MPNRKTTLAIDHMDDALHYAPPLHVVAKDGWVAGISSGAVLPCSDCGVVPDFEYLVTDDFWREHVPDSPARLSVVCLPCLDRRCGGRGSSEALRQVQFIGAGQTIVLQPTLIFAYGQ